MKVDRSELGVVLELIYKIGKTMGQEDVREMGDMIGLSVGLAVGIIGKK